MNSPAVSKMRKNPKLNHLSLPIYASRTFIGFDRQIGIPHRLFGYLK
jgi:hypothetical protein